MTVDYRIGDVFDQLALIPDDSIDLVVTSPPFLALRSYLPAEHPDKDKEIGSEKNPAAFIDVMLDLTAELRRVLAPHGSICVELGDTYSGSGGAGGDYNESGWRETQPKFKQQKGAGWPQAKSLSMIPESYRWALAYGRNPFNMGTTGPAGTWLIRNVIRWVRPNPAPGALGDKWRPATSEMVVACLSPKRYWDDIATRQPHVVDPGQRSLLSGLSPKREDIGDSGNWTNKGNPAGRPLLDWWELNPGGFPGAHYAVYPPDLVVPCVKAMAPSAVCRNCGEPSRPVNSVLGVFDKSGQEMEWETWTSGMKEGKGAHSNLSSAGTTLVEYDGWSDCACTSHCTGEHPCDEHWRRGVVLDPFAGSGTTLHVADALGRDAIGIDLDERNKTIYQQRTNERRFNELRQLTLNI